MKAHVGDHVTIKGHRVGEAERTGEILEVHDEGGEVRYLIRWADDHEAWLYPGPDAFFESKRKTSTTS